MPDNGSDHRSQRPKQMNQPRKTDAKKNTLQASQRFALWQELVKAKAELEAERATYEQAAEKMSQRLGFKVSKANVGDAVEQSIVKWKTPGRGGNNRTKTSRRVDDLETRVAALEDIILRLCEASGTGKAVEYATTRVLGV